MLVAWVACLAMSERPADTALENDGEIKKPAERTDAIDLTDFDPLDAKPAGLIKSKTYKPPPKEPPKLPDEGSKVVDRLCRIIVEPKSGWVLVRFPAEGNRSAIRPRWALPNQTLEIIEARHAANPKLRFRISGEMTVYDKNSFILIRRVSIVEPEAKKPEPKTPAPKTQPKPKAGSETKPAGETKPAADTQPAAEPSSSDLMKAMLAEKNATPVIPPRRKTKIDAAKVKSVAPGAKGDVIQPATARLIVDRLMTIMKTDNARWRQATFEADNTLREPPVILLPCRLLAYAEVQPPSATLRITGEITNYKGKRYMLLRKVLIEREMDRL